MSVEIQFTLSDGTQQILSAEVGESIMHVAVEHGVPGIIGECGGELSCATCHVRVLESDATFRSMSGDEDDLLEAVDDREDRSRLGCQLLLRPEMTSVRIEVP